MPKATSPKSTTAPGVSPTDVPTDVEHQCDEPLLLTIDDVAEKLRVKPWSVYQLCDSGRLPSVYLGPKSRRVRPQDLRDFVDGLPTERPLDAKALADLSA